MKPLLTVVRVRHDGVPVPGGNPRIRRLLDTCGGAGEYLEMPGPADQAAHDFALAFMDAVARARGEWIYFLSDRASPGEGAVADALRRLTDGRSGDPLGMAWSARVRHADGVESPLFAEGFSLDALETGKARHPGLADPAWFLSCFLFKASLAGQLAEALVSAVDPVPSVLAFTAAARLEPLLRQGRLLEQREPALVLEEIPAPEAVVARAMADFEAGRAEESLAALDYIKFAWGPNPAVDLHRAVLNARLERYWLATFSVRRFLLRNKGNAPGAKLAEALAARKGRIRAGYPAAASLLDAVDAEGACEGERELFERVGALHDQAVIVALGDFPLRAALAMALACLGTARKVVALSPFRDGAGGKRAWGCGRDAWKAAVSRFDLDDNAEDSASIRSRLAGWGDAPRPDLLYLSLGGDRGVGREDIEAAFALLREGGVLVVDGATAERPDAWRFWVESAEPALADRGREGALRWGRKTGAPLGGERPAVPLQELWRRSRLPEPFERTMLTFDRFRNAFTVARAADIRGLPGAIVECGVWKGGCSAAMLLAAQETGSRRALWAFDSFQGLPRPTEKDGGWAFEKSDEWGGAGCEATEEDFRETLFRIAGLKDENVHVRKGWFQDTLPAAKHEIGPIAILRLDGDWYESVLVCLEHLYDQVVPGGYILIDDYGYWEGARKATDEFRARRGIRSPLVTTDREERYWVKVDEAGTGSWSAAGEAARAALAEGKGHGVA